MRPVIRRTDEYGQRHLTRKGVALCGLEVPGMTPLVHSLQCLRNFIFNKGSEANCGECEELMLQEVCEFEAAPGFIPEGYTCSLEPEEVMPGHQNETGVFCHRHEDKWMIKGNIHEDAYYWVDSFVAYHPQYRFVFGDFNDVVYASSEEGYKHFIAHHAPNTWDLGDI
jgi:hypothetical protein